MSDYFHKLLNPTPPPPPKPPLEGDARHQVYITPARKILHYRGDKPYNASAYRYVNGQRQHEPHGFDFGHNLDRVIDGAKRDYIYKWNLNCCPKIRWVDVDFFVLPLEDRRPCKPEATDD